MPQSFEPSANQNVPTEPQPEYTQEERTSLVQLAHEAIVATLENRAPGHFSPTPHLAESRGAFTTVYSRGQLRGCVGYPAATMPLYRAVIETAQSAAFEDPRFVPVTLSEVPDLGVSISVLSPVFPIRAEEVVVGRHGLIVSQHGQRGLLLPQVPVEHGWDRVTFLEQTCRKAGLALNAWKSGATIEAFTAEVFGGPGVEG